MSKQPELQIATFYQSYVALFAVIEGEKTYTVAVTSTYHGGQKFTVYHCNCRRDKRACRHALALKRRVEKEDTE